MIQDNALHTSYTGPNLFCHALSMVLGDHIEGEVGVSQLMSRFGEEEIDFNAYKKVSFQGAGIGEIVKAMMIGKMA